jgi:hypothetical protein
MGDDGDLVSLRLFLVAPDAQQDLWREGTTMASMPIEFEAGDASSAKVAFGRAAVDICVLDESVSDADRASVVKEARRSKPSASLFLSCARSGPILRAQWAQRRNRQCLWPPAQRGRGGQADRNIYSPEEPDPSTGSR